MSTRSGKGKTKRGVVERVAPGLRGGGGGVWKTEAGECGKNEVIRSSTIAVALNAEFKT